MEAMANGKSQTFRRCHVAGALQPWNLAGPKIFKPRNTRNTRKKARAQVAVLVLDSLGLPEYKVFKWNSTGQP